MIGRPVHRVLGQTRYVHRLTSTITGECVASWTSFQAPAKTVLQDRVMIERHEEPGLHHIVNEQFGVIDYHSVNWEVFSTLHDQMLRGRYNEAIREIEGMDNANLRAFIASLLCVDVEHIFLELLRTDVAYHLLRWIRFRRDVFGEVVTPRTLDELATVQGWSMATLAALAELDATRVDLAAVVRISHDERRKTVASYVRNHPEALWRPSRDTSRLVAVPEAATVCSVYRGQDVASVDAVQDVHTVQDVPPVVADQVDQQHDVAPDSDMTALLFAAIKMLQNADTVLLDRYDMLAVQQNGPIVSIQLIHRTR